MILYLNLRKSFFEVNGNQPRNKVSQKTLQSMHFRRSHIRITQEAYNFLMDELNKRFSKYGEINL